ncbi:MAG: hypothetical protein AABZ15_07170 [Nitrospirota bacterium]
MRKTWFFSLLLMLALLAAAGPSMAAESSPLGKDVTLAIGMKFWFNTWQSAQGSNGAQQGTNVQSYISDSNVAFTPSISLKIKDFFVSTSFLGAPEYTFPEYSDTIVITSGPTTTAYTLNHKTTATRTESDTNIGWYVTPNLALTLGYKIVNLEITDKRSGTGLLSRTVIDKATYTGPTIGFIGSVPIGEGFGLYGNLALGKMDMEYQGGTTTYDADYVSTEIGVGYKEKSMPLSFTMGYRFQSIEQKLPSYQIGGPGTPISPDVTKGFTFGINLIF